VAGSATLHPYSAADEDAVIELWRRTWQQHYPQIDFNARVAWWRERWRNELVPATRIVLAEIDDASVSASSELPHTPFISMQAGIQGQPHSPENIGPGSPRARGRTGKTLVGFVTVDPKTMYLDQIVVAPEHWGSGVALTLLNEAKRLSPRGLDLLVNKDNFRAIRFYEKHGFVYAGEDKNPVSGKPVNRMAWRA
jgi:putative acetyltransferase